MPLLQPETMILGDTTFTIGCQPATVGWDLSADVANILSTTNVQASVNSGDADALLAAIRALMAVPGPQLKRVRTALFEYIEFTNGRAATPQKAGGRRGNGFQCGGAVQPGHLEGVCSVLSRKFFGILGDAELPPPRPAKYNAVSTHRIPGPLAALITADPPLCTYRDLQERLTLRQAFDLIEALAVKRENEHRAYEQARRESEQNNQRGR